MKWFKILWVDEQDHWLGDLSLELHRCLSSFLISFEPNNETVLSAFVFHLDEPFRPRKKLINPNLKNPSNRLSTVDLTHGNYWRQQTSSFLCVTRPFFSPWPEPLELTKILDNCWQGNGGVCRDRFLVLNRLFRDRSFEPSTKTRDARLSLFAKRSLAQRHRLLSVTKLPRVLGCGAERKYPVSKLSL